MIEKKRNGVYRLFINGKSEELCIDGDGWKQIDAFRELEKYAKSHSMNIVSSTMPMVGNSHPQDVLSASSEKYEIVAFRANIPGATNILFAPQYRVQIHNKKTKQIQTYMGTVANFMFDMLNNFRGQQK